MYPYLILRGSHVSGEQSGGVFIPVTTRSSSLSPGAPQAMASSCSPTFHHHRPSLLRISPQCVCTRHIIPIGTPYLYTNTGIQVYEHRYMSTAAVRCSNQIRVVTNSTVDPCSRPWGAKPVFSPWFGTAPLASGARGTDTLLLARTTTE